MNYIFPHEEEEFSTRKMHASRFNLLKNHVHEIFKLLRTHAPSLAVNEDESLYICICMRLSLFTCLQVTKCLNGTIEGFQACNGIYPYSSWLFPTQIVSKNIKSIDVLGFE